MVKQRATKKTGGRAGVRGDDGTRVGEVVVPHHVVHGLFFRLENGGWPSGIMPAHSAWWTGMGCFVPKVPCLRLEPKRRGAEGRKKATKKRGGEGEACQLGSDQAKNGETAGHCLLSGGVMGGSRDGGKIRPRFWYVRVDVEDGGCEENGNVAMRVFFFFFF